MRTLCSLTVSLLLVGCTSIHQIGTVGTLKVFSIKDTDFFSANRLLLVVDEQGHAVAAAGGTVSGPGPIASGLIGAVVVGAGVAYAGQAVKGGLQGVNLKTNDLTVTGIPKQIELKPVAP